MTGSCLSAGRAPAGRTGSGGTGSDCVGIDTLGSGVPHISQKLLSGVNVAPHRGHVSIASGVGIATVGGCAGVCVDELAACFGRASPVNGCPQYSQNAASSGCRAPQLEHTTIRFLPLRLFPEISYANALLMQTSRNTAKLIRLGEKLKPFPARSDAMDGGAVNR